MLYMTNFNINNSNSRILFTSDHNVNNNSNSADKKNVSDINLEEMFVDKVSLFYRITSKLPTSSEKIISIKTEDPATRQIATRYLRIGKEITAYVPTKNLEALLSRYDNIERIKAVMKTVWNGIQLLKEGVPNTNIYQKSSKEKNCLPENRLTESSDSEQEDEKIPKESESFFITKKGNLIIETKFIAKGGNKKVSDTFNVTKGQKKSKVKIVVRGKDRIAKVERQFVLQEMFYQAYPKLFMKPSKIRIKQDAEEKLVYLDPKMDGDGFEIEEFQITKIGQFTYNLAKILTAMHNMGYAHMDVKSDNFLIQGKEVKASDLESAIPFAESDKIFLGGTPDYMPPEYLKIEGYEISLLPKDQRPPKVGPSFDSFSLGMTILLMLKNDLFKFCFIEYGVIHFGFLNEEQRKDIFNRMEWNANVYSQSFSSEEILLRSKLLELAKQLTAIKPGQRMDTKQVIHELKPHMH